MNGLYNLRRRDTEIDPILGPIFPNVPGPSPPYIKDVSQSETDETENALLNAMKIVQGLKGESEQKGQPTQGGETPASRNVVSILPEPTPVKNALLGRTPQMIEKSTNLGGGVFPEGVRISKYAPGGESPIYHMEYKNKPFWAKFIERTTGQQVHPPAGWKAESPDTGRWYKIARTPQEQANLDAMYSDPNEFGEEFANRYKTWLNRNEVSPTQVGYGGGGVGMGMGEAGVGAGGGFSGSILSRQKGGGAKAGKTYMVGEEGPEVFVPKVDGIVIPYSGRENIPNPAEGALFPETTPANALLRAGIPTTTTTPVTEKPTNALLDYWAKPVIGKMPLDKFVQIAGALSSAIAPREWSGRVGNVLSQIGGQAYEERVKEPENILRRRLLEKQIMEPPTDWQALYQDLEGKIDPETGKVYTAGGKIKYFNKLKETLKEPQYDIDVQQDPAGKWQHGRRNKLTGVFMADRVATPAEIENKVTGKPPTEPLPSFQEYKRTPGNEGKTYEDFRKWEVDLKAKESKGFQPHSFIKPDGTMGWVEPGKEVPKGWKPYEKTEKAEKLTMADVKSAYSMDIGNIKNQMMIEMTPDEQMNLSGQPGENILALLLAGKVGKSLSPERKKYYTGKLQEAETYYGDLSNQVLGKKGAKIPTKVQGVITPEVEIEGGLISSRGKIIPGPSPGIFKDKQGKEMVKDPTSSTGWRYR